MTQESAPDEERPALPEGFEYGSESDLGITHQVCGTDAQAKTVYWSHHNDQFRGGVGSGQVTPAATPWCGNCQDEPPTYQSTKLR